MKACSLDLRERIVKSAQSGKPVSEVARIFEVGVSTIKRYLARAKSGDLAPKFSPGRPRNIPVEDQAELVAQLDASPDATLEEHCSAWEKSHGLKVSVSTMHRSIKRSGYTLKERR